MNIQDLKNADELYFIDIETVGDIGICQIGITKWSRLEQRLCNVFNEIINPDVAPEKINIHALRVHGISEYTWSKAGTYYDHHDHIKKILNGKIVLQWGGSDINIINKNIESYRLDPINTTSLNSWSYHHKGIKLTTAALKLGVSYNGYHRAPFDSYLAALLFVTEFCNYEMTSIDKKIMDSFNSRSQPRSHKFQVSQIKTNGSGDEICLTGFTSEEKKKYGELLAEKGFRVRSNVTSNLRILITPAGSYSRSPAKEAEATRVGAEIMNLDSLLKRFAMK